MRVKELAGELFNALAGTKITHVPYKGDAPAMLDLIGGQVQMYFATYATARPQMDAKKVRALGLTRKQRFELLPDLPTIDEAGVRGFEVANWYAIFAPAGTPKEILARLNREIVRALAQPDVKARMLQAGVVAVSSTPEELAQFHRIEMEKMGKSHPGGQNHTGVIARARGHTARCWRSTSWQARSSGNTRAAVSAGFSKP